MAEGGESQGQVRKNLSIQVSKSLYVDGYIQWPGIGSHTHTTANQWQHIDKGWDWFGGFRLEIYCDKLDLTYCLPDKIGSQISRFCTQL
jgi:hypothetical protein